MALSSPVLTVLLAATVRSSTEDDPLAALDVGPAPWYVASAVATALEDSPTVLFVLMLKYELSEVECPVLAAAFVRSDPDDTACRANKYIDHAKSMQSKDVLRIIYLCHSQSNRLDSEAEVHLHPQLIVL